MKIYAVWVQEGYADQNRTDTKYSYMGILICFLFFCVDFWNWIIRLWSIYRLNRNAHSQAEANVHFNKRIQISNTWRLAFKLFLFLTLWRGLKGISIYDELFYTHWFCIDILIDFFSIPFAMRMKQLKNYSEINLILYSF